MSIEDRFCSSTPEPESTLEERVKCFAKLLHGLWKESGKNIDQLAQEAGVSRHKIKGWQKYNDPTHFPGDEQLTPQVAEAYGVELERIREAARVSREARNEEKSMNKSARQRTGSGGAGPFEHSPRGPTYGRGSKKPKS